MTRKSRFSLILILGLAVLGWLLIDPNQTEAQTEGNDAIYNASNGITFSPSFIDASQFLNPLTQGQDLCDTIYGIFTNKWGVAVYPSTGAVIDARGISGATNLKCTHGSPWTEGSTTVTAPSTILLPATGGTTATPIIISTPWILPANTRLIGEGDGIPASGFTPGTTIQAKSSGFSGSMIQFGSSSVCPSGTCIGISVENLTLDGLKQAVGGITNAYSQDFSYVNHVTLYQILGTGLAVSGNANNSGPYSNITFDTGGSSGLSSTVCASLNGLSGTLGIHGLSCNSETNDANAAVLLDASNNSIEDVRIVGFYDGIRVGANNNAQSNLLINIIGDTPEPTCQPTSRAKGAREMMG